MFKCSDMTLSYFYSELFICLGHLLHIGQKSVCFCVWNASRAIDKRAAKPGQHIFRHATSQWHFQRLSSPFRCTGKKKCPVLEGLAVLRLCEGLMGTRLTFLMCQIFIWPPDDQSAWSLRPWFLLAYGCELQHIYHLRKLWLAQTLHESRSLNLISVSCSVSGSKLAALPTLSLSW